MDAGIALAHKLTGRQYDAETLKPYHYLTSQNVNYDIVPKNKMGFWIKYNNMMELYIADNFFLHDFLSAFIETCDKYNYDFRDFIASFLIDDKGKAFGIKGYDLIFDAQEDIDYYPFYTNIYDGEVEDYD